MEAGTAFHSLHAPSQQRIGGGKSVLGQGALSTSLDRLTGELGLPSPTILKLDVDGHELKIVEGARALLNKGTIRSLLIEINGELEGEDVSPVPKILAECGYELVSKGKGVRTGTGETSRNCIFRKK